MNKKSKNNLLLGSHVSIEGGLYKALERGAQIGCTTIQIFTTSSRQWNNKKLTETDIERFKATQKATHIMPVAHCSYLINVASSKAMVRNKSVAMLIQEIERCNELGIPFAVLHPGSKLDGDEHEALEFVAHALDVALEKSNKSTIILLETMAGQGSTLGATFEQLATIRSLSKEKKYVGVCADTCHLFAAGYDFRTPQGYQNLWKEFDKHIGLSHLKVIHMNDSKKDCGSRVDRHEEIGKGLIGKAAFGFIMNDPHLKNVAKILETPKATLDDDRRNLDTLEGLIK